MLVQLGDDLSLRLPKDPISNDVFAESVVTVGLAS